MAITHSVATMTTTDRCWFDRPEISRQFLFCIVYLLACFAVQGVVRTAYCILSFP